MITGSDAKMDNTWSLKLINDGVACLVKEFQTRLDGQQFIFKLTAAILIRVGGQIIGKVNFHVLCRQLLRVHNSKLWAVSILIKQFVLTCDNVQTKVNGDTNTLL